MGDKKQRKKIIHTKRSKRPAKLKNEKKSSKRKRVMSVYRNRVTEGLAEKEGNTERPSST